MQLGFQLQQEQKMKQIMTPQLRQAIQLLHMSSLELAEYIIHLGETNPFLDINDANPVQQPFVKSFDAKEIVSPYSDTLESYLLEQLRLMDLSKETARICRYIAGNLDENGYLAGAIEDHCRLLEIEEAVFVQALETIHSLDPIGVGARSLKECLLLQIKHREGTASLTFILLRDYFEQLLTADMMRLSKELGVDRCDVEHSLTVIQSLNPKPGSQYGVVNPHFIVPDLVVKEQNGYGVFYNKGIIPDVRLDCHFEECYRRAKQGASISFLTQMHAYRTEASMIMKAMEQRKQTLLRVTEEVVSVQHEFLSKGERYMKPLTLKTIAERIGVHESTVSRAVNEKYVLTPRGVFPLTFFFGSALETTGSEPASSKAVKASILDMIRNENKESPVSDQQIAKTLTTEGIRISRRTVAKYRHALGIPNSQQRVTNM